MNKKLKKILAGIGLCAVVGCGAMFATGCAGVNLTQDQVDKIVSIADNGKNWIDETLDILQANNNKLNSSDALNLYERARLRLAVNEDNVWSNLKITLNENFGDVGFISYEMKAFKAENELGVIVSTYEGEVEGEPFSDSERYDFEEIANQEVPEGEMEQTITFSGVMNYYMGPISYSMVDAETEELYKLTENDILSCEYLENGKVKIVASCYEMFAASEFTNAGPILCEFIIDTEGYLQSCKYSFIGAEEGIMNEATIVIKMNFEYNVLTTADVAE